MTSDSNPIRVAHVISGLSVGGAEVALERLVTSLDRGAFDCRVWSLGALGEIGRRIVARGIPVEAVGMHAGATAAAHGALRLRRALSGFAPDLVQGWMYHGNLAATLCAPAGSAAVLWNIRGSLESLRFEKPATRAVIRCSRIVARRARRIVNNSASSARAHERFGYPADRWEMIPNGFDTQRFVPAADRRRDARARLGLPEDAFVVGTLGRYVAVKGHADLLDALAAATARGTLAHAVFAGPGLVADDGEFDRLRRARAPSVPIVAAGSVDAPEQLLPAFDVLCLPSRSEGFPNVVGEAMSCGIPCIVTDVGDAAWLVADTGWVVPPADVPALAAALEQAAATAPAERARRGALARERIVAHFSLETMLERYARLYRRLAAGERA